MSSLKAEIKSIFEQETSKVEEERFQKLKEIEQKFKTLHKLSAEHVARGSRHRGAGSEIQDQAADELLLQNFERYSKDYEDQVRKANKEKQALRKEIFETERAIRQKRDLLANKETESKNLKYLLDRELELSKDKAMREEQALRLLNDDLSEQLNAIQQQEGKADGGLVTPNLLNKQLEGQKKKTLDELKKFVDDSESELNEISRELGMMQS